MDQNILMCVWEGVGEWQRLVRQENQIPDFTFTIICRRKRLFSSRPWQLANMVYQPGNMRCSVAHIFSYKTVFFVPMHATYALYLYLLDSVLWGGLVFMA